MLLNKNKVYFYRFLNYNQKLINIKKYLQIFSIFFFFLIKDNWLTLTFMKFRYYLLDQRFILATTIYVQKTPFSNRNIAQFVNNYIIKTGWNVFFYIIIHRYCKRNGNWTFVFFSCNDLLKYWYYRVSQTFEAHNYSCFYIWRIVIVNSKSVLIVIKLVSNNYIYYWHGVYYNSTGGVLTSTWLEKKIKHVRKRKRLNGTFGCPSKREVWFSITECLTLLLF